MKRILVLFLITTFLVSMLGCVAKTAHEKLLEEKTAVQKTCEGLLAKEKELRAEISDRQSDIRNLRTDLKKAKAEIKDLDMELAKSKAEIAEFKK